jgi:hypothetical protein
LKFPDWHCNFFPIYLTHELYCRARMKDLYFQICDKLQ